MSKMPLAMIKVGRIIHAAPDKVWNLLTDTARWSEWGPTVKAVQSESRYIRAGATGRVKTALGFWAPFRVTEWTEGQFWSWRIFNIRATGHRIDVTAADCCRLIFEVPLWAAPYAIICQIAARRIARTLEAGDSPG
jgi:hypothetical protein